MKFYLPLKLEVSLNTREHWAVKARKVKAERAAVALGFRSKPWRRQYAQAVALDSESTWEITLTRLSPRKLDGDNLQGRFKGVRDQVAYELGMDDGDPRLVWTYAQEQVHLDELGVSIQILPTSGPAVERERVILSAPESILEAAAAPPLRRKRKAVVRQGAP
jgi:hypothetical protein